ncbi:MAG: threonine dehydratase [Acidimicrobiales bacterium]
MELTADALANARRIVDAAMAPTPQYAWPLLAEEFGAEVWVKHESATPTGAFKVRGGLVYAERLARERPEVAGLASATTGNHGQSLAYAGRAAGVPVTIVVPHGNSVEKNAAMRGFGAELIEHGADFQEAREFSIGLAADRGLEMVPPFHPDLVAGVATYPAELFAAAGELDAVFVPVGMGSGIVATILVRDLLGLSTEVIGVVSENAPAVARSFAAGEPVGTETSRTFADGVATRSVDPVAFDIVRRGASRIVTIAEDDIAAAMRLAYRATHTLPCGAGSLGLAALTAERDRWVGKRVGVTFTSSNIDTDKAALVLSGGTPAA